MVWQSFPERMVGFLTWSHFWNEAQGGWGYTGERANEFSMVLTSAAFYHRYRWYPRRWTQRVTETPLFEPGAGWYWSEHIQLAYSPEIQVQGHFPVL